MANASTNWELLTGLFPHWTPTIQEKSLYRKALQNRRFEMMETAIEDFRTFNKFREPNLGGILKEYSRLIAELDRKSGVTKIDDSGVSEEQMELEANLSNAKILFELELMGEEELRMVKSEVAKIPVLTSLVGRTSGSIQDWTKLARGLIWAKAEQMNLTAGSSLLTPPQSPSLDTE
jgi:hypothetical protein